MSSAEKALQAKFKKILEELLKEKENRVCADCKTRSPRWASSTLGVFICIRCSGIHRNMGVHISFVRSVNLDSWTGKEVRMMQKWGNRKANMYWEAKFSDESIRPNEQSTMQETEKFIRMKYEQQKWVDPNFDISILESGTKSHPNKTHSRHQSSHKNDPNKPPNKSDIVNKTNDVINNNDHNNYENTGQVHTRRKSIEELREIAVKLPGVEITDTNNNTHHNVSKPRKNSINSLKDNMKISSNQIPDDFWNDTPPPINKDPFSDHNTSNQNNDIDIFQDMDTNTNPPLNKSNNVDDDLMNFGMDPGKSNVLNNQDIDDLFNNISTNTINSDINTFDTSLQEKKPFISNNSMDNIDVYMNINNIPPKIRNNQVQQRTVAMNRMMNMIPTSPTQTNNIMGGMGMMGGSPLNIPPPMALGGGMGMMGQGMMNMGIPSSNIGGMPYSTTPNRRQGRVPPKY